MYKINDQKGIVGTFCVSIFTQGFLGIVVLKQKYEFRLLFYDTIYTCFVNRILRRFQVSLI